MRLKKLSCLPLAALCLVLSACSALLEGEQSRVEPHADRYWESAADDIMRAESYQDLVNALLLLIEEQEPSGVVRLYLSDVSYAQAWDTVRTACAEVREETAVGSYSLHALDFRVEELRDSYYEVSLQPVYRRTAEDLERMVEISSSSAIYDMVLLAWQRGEEGLTVRYTYLSEDESVLAENILLLQQELEGGGAEAPPEAPSQSDGAEGEETQQTPLTPWEIYFYPPGGESSIVEIFFHSQGEQQAPAEPGGEEPGQGEGGEPAA